MAPSKKVRKAEWEKRKGMLLELYLGQKLSLDAMLSILESSGLIAT